MKLQITIPDELFPVLTENQLIQYIIDKITIELKKSQIKINNLEG